jgi:PAS domain S-box-containing protein
MSSKNNCATTHGTNSGLMRFLPEMLDDLPYLVAQVGPDGRYLYVNRAYAQWFGLRAEDMLGRLQSEHMGPKLGFRVGEGLRAAFLGNAVEIDHEVRGADGSNRIMQANYLPHFDSGKPASRVTVMLRDVTEKRRQLVCFGQTQRNFQLLVENCKDVIFRLRLIDGVYEYVSPASLEVTGYPPETYYNEPLHIKNFIHPDWRDRLELRWRLLQDGSDVPESFEFQIVHPLKGDRWISQRNSLVRDGQGQPVVLEGAATDVTEMKLKEEELARAKALAESASKAKSEFLARVSHETRTPLHGILGQAGLALEQTKDPVLGRRLKAIRDSASHLHAMVSDILDFSDLETGHVQSGPDDAPFSLSELVWRVGDMFKTQAAEKGLEFKVVIQPGTPVNVVGDGRRLRQILVHLLSNAIKFTESGETLLTLESAPPQGASASLDQKSTAPIRFTVSDTGPGMTPKVLDSILNGFQQGRGDLGGRPQGLGLGLSLARRMVELLGGVLHVESRPGQGSDFSFTLPLSKNPNAEGASSPEEQRNEPLRILLAEDNPLSASLMSEWLVRAGHQPFLARNGREALEKLKTESCDVALMDLEMPLMSGLEAANRVRAGECGEAVRSMPIYAITAHVLPEYKEMCEHIGITGFFSKPLDMNTLLSVLGVVDRTDAEASNSDPTGDETADEGLPDKSAQIREFGGNDAFVKKLYALFRNQSSKEIKIIRESLFKGDVEAALRGSHSMKNSALGVGAHRLAKLAEDFQKSNVRDLSGAAHHLEALEAELTRVLNWIG